MDHRRTTWMRGSGARSVKLTAVILSALFLVLGVVIGAAPLYPTVPETSPHVKPAIDGVLDLFKTKEVVALGDFHGLAQEEAFYSALVRDPRFAREVGNVVVEFGGAEAQGIIDRYVNGENVPFAELRHVWTDVVGWLPGPFALGYVNFFANVRAANLKLPPGQRIKVWLGDPKIDWSKIHSFHEVQPILARRDDHIAGIIIQQILRKHRKTLLIIGTGHLVPMEAGSRVIPQPVVAKIASVDPNALAVVAPFTGYIEPGCNAKFIARTKGWPVPAIVGPIKDTWLNSELQLPGCHYLAPEQIEQLKRQFGAIQWLGPGKPPSMVSFQINMRSGVKSNAILYLGPPDTLTRSPSEPSIYLDPRYFNEMNRRAECCTPNSHKLDWDEILQQNSVAPSKFQPR